MTFYIVLTADQTDSLYQKCADQVLVSRVSAFTRTEVRAPLMSQPFPRVRSTLLPWVLHDHWSPLGSVGLKGDVRSHGRSVDRTRGNGCDIRGARTSVRVKALTLDTNT